MLEHFFQKKTFNALCYMVAGFYLASTIAMFLVFYFDICSLQIGIWCPSNRWMQFAIQFCSPASWEIIIFFVSALFFFGSLSFRLLLILLSMAFINFLAFRGVFLLTYSLWKNKVHKLNKVSDA